MGHQDDSRAWTGDPSTVEPQRLPAHGPDRSGVRPLPGPPEASGDDDLLLEAFLGAEHMAELPTPIAAIRFALGLLRSLVPSEAAFASLYDIDDDVLRVVSMDPAAPTLPGPSLLPIDRGIVARALATLDPPLRLVDGTDGERLASTEGGRIMYARNAIYMPLRIEGRLLGLVHMVNRDGPGFSDADAGVVSYVGERLAECLHMAR